MRRTIREGPSVGTRRHPLSRTTATTNKGSRMRILTAVLTAAGIGLAAATLPVTAEAASLPGVIINIDGSGESLRLRDIRPGADRWMWLRPGWSSNPAFFDVDRVYAPCAKGRLLWSKVGRADPDLGGREDVPGGVVVRLYTRGCQ